LAAGKASNAEVKSFGQRMVTDHGKANQELTEIASRKGITLPKDVDKKHMAAIDKMSKLSGAAFDKAFMTGMHKDHMKAVSAFEKEASKGQDADIKAFAAKTLPTLKEHLQMAT